MVNRICTSIEQSKHLIELGIDINTADMCWSTANPDLEVLLAFPFTDADNTYDDKIPAWSLNALLELMPIETHLYKMQDEDDYTKHYYKVGSSDHKGWIELNNALSIDAAYEMVCWLKENDAL